MARKIKQAQYFLRYHWKLLSNNTRNITIEILIKIWVDYHTVMNEHLLKIEKLLEVHERLIPGDLSPVSKIWSPIGDPTSCIPM